ncbi:hypothetical protein [Klebsiella pneumoniae]|uniref:hypothetical protein n=1 Tax=Klebsiella pneumoniae TaxID=573 RepID=UPI001D182EB3|nr:hypothetical protein [Klebsiella pneumoniae]
MITHLNKDRRALNSLIHDARRENGETGKEEITLPVLVTSNIRDGELRKTVDLDAHKEAVALVDNVYHRISKVDKANQLITLTDSEGKERYISPREASAEGVTLYRQEKITVSQGDRMRFSKSDLERGYVANSIWEVQSVSGDSVTLSDGKTHPYADPEGGSGAAAYRPSPTPLRPTAPRGPANRMPSRWKGWPVVGNRWPALSLPMWRYPA